MKLQLHRESNPGCTEKIEDIHCGWLMLQNCIMIMGYNSWLKLCEAELKSHNWALLENKRRTSVTTYGRNICGCITHSLVENVFWILSSPVSQGPQNPYWSLPVWPPQWAGWWSWLRTGRPGPVSPGWTQHQQPAAWCPPPAPWLSSRCSLWRMTGHIVSQSAPRSHSSTSNMKGSCCFSNRVCVE